MTVPQAPHGLGTALAAVLARAFWTSASWTIGTRRLVGCLRRALPSAYGDTLFYFGGDVPPLRSDDADEVVALTIDDAFVRGDASCSMVKEVLDLLAAHDATATFFACTEYTTSEDARSVVEAGHEVGNHLHADRSMHYPRLSTEDFREALRETNRALEEACGVRPRWFRAPQGIMTTSMAAAVEAEGMTHVLCDGYCDDWIFAENGNAGAVAPIMLRQVRAGSIALLHMPERGFREAGLRALSELLEGLRERGTRCVSVSRMVELRAAEARPGERQPMAALADIEKTS